MKKNMLMFLISLFVFSGVVIAGEVMHDGAEAGKWTMDYDAAIEYAQKNKKSVFLKFTGSDWCKWCILMEKSVFTSDSWYDYADENLVLVTLDYPQDKNIVPEKYKQRNKSLQGQFGVSGYPTYIILDYDGKTRLGQLGAGKEKSAESFIFEVQGLLKNSLANMDRFAAGLSNKQAEAYKSHFAEMNHAKNELDAWVKTQPARTPENMALYKTYQQRISDALYQMRQIEIDKYAGLMSENDAHDYRVLNARFGGAEAEMHAWLDTSPQQNAENNLKYMKYQETLKGFMSSIKSREDSVN